LPNRVRGVAGKDAALVSTRYPPPRPGPLARLASGAAAAASVLAGKVLIGLGLRRPPEGWRRTVGILLRSEHTRFALSAFGLEVPDAGTGAQPQTLQSRTARALHAFLATEPEAHFRLEWQPALTVRRLIPFVDLAVLSFGDDGGLEAIDMHPAAGSPALPPTHVRARVDQAVLAAYNRTTGLPEVERTRRLPAEVRTALAGSDSHALAYAERLLSACCLSFEPRELRDPVQRFCPPAFARRRTLGFGYLSWVARPDEARGSADLWVSAHHVGLDGVPLQDLLNRLERVWGAAGDVVFPPPGAGRAFIGPHACHAPGEREVDELIAFVDLSPVLSLRRALKARHGGAIGGDVTLGALLAWLLTREPEFARARIASTVDIAASGGYERDVDVVSLRPADFGAGDPEWGGFVAFVREFNRLIAAARARTSPVRAGMQTAGLIPAWAHALVVRGNPASLDEAFGTLCVTIIRDARVFVAPMTDLGLGQGFFAIGSARLPSANGACVTSVSIKGDAGRVAHYPGLLQRTIERASRLHAALAAEAAG
jgi:hypothetical protein